MNSLQDLNGYGTTEVEITDLRPAGVVFSRSTLPQETNISSIAVPVVPGNDISEIINYATADVKYIVTIRSEGVGFTSTISWNPNLPSYMTVVKTGNTYTISGFRSYKDWDLIKNPTWNLPINYNTYEIFYLENAIEYFDGKKGLRVSENWDFYDDRFYFFARLKAEASTSVVGVRAKGLSASMSSSFKVELKAEIAMESAFSMTADFEIVTVFTANIQSFSIVSAKLRADYKARSNMSATANVIAKGTTRVYATSVINAAFGLSIIAVPEPALTLIYDTTKTTDKTINIPIGEVSTANLTINWGDGTTSTITPSTDNRFYSKTYANNGIYTVKIAGPGVLRDFLYQGPEANPKPVCLTEVRSWGTIGLTSIRNLMLDAVNLTQVPNNLPSTINTFSGIYEAFKGCTNFNGSNVADWDVSSITQFRSIFERCENFNIDISSWNVSNGQDFQYMFYGAKRFNKPLNGWNVGNAIYLAGMFQDSAFNQPLNNWNVSKCQYFGGMFANCPFNQNINTWNVTQGKYFDGMFSNQYFNQPLNNWNTGNAISMYTMFGYSQYEVDTLGKRTVFNQDISMWNVSNVVEMGSMFAGNSSFNRNIGSWNVAKVGQTLGSGGTGFSYMFYKATSFNQNLSGWATTYYSSKPTGFDDGATAWTNQSWRPVW